MLSKVLETVEVEREEVLEALLENLDSLDREKKEVNPQRLWVLFLHGLSFPWNTGLTSFSVLPARLRPKPPLLVRPVGH
jgi:hypothetical protein